MNTGDRNIKGRPILKGPRGGLYVIGPSGAKYRDFTKAAAPPAAPRVATPNTTYKGPAIITHKGSTFHKTNVMNSTGVPIYKKGGASSWYKIGSNYIPHRILVSSSVHRGNGVYMHLKNYLKAPAPAAPPPRVATPPMSAALKAAIAHIGKLKTPAGRARHVASMRSKLSANNFAVLERRAANMGVSTAPRASAPAAATAPRRASASSATPRITTAERNVRLAAIRARLNAMRAARVAAMPKRRANVHKRLKNVVARVRARLGARNTPTFSTLVVPFCHAPASVPRKPCKVRKASITVFRSPLIDDGTMVATRASDIDLDWFKRQDKYVKNLSDYDYWTAQAHTNRSHGWIGPFLYRGTVPSSLPGRSGGGHTHIAPLWPQIRKMILDDTYIFRSGADTWRDSWARDFKRMTSEQSRYNLYAANMSHLPALVLKRALEMYRDDLKRIIAGAPKSRKKMILYRGASFDIFRSTRGYWHTLESFCSAAYDLNHALGYEGGSMQRITVLPGTPVLLVAGMNQWGRNGEYEIMVNLGTKYLIRGRGVSRVIWTGRYGRKVRVTDVTITK